MIIFIRFKTQKASKPIPDFFIEHYPMWKSVYHEISKHVHSDKGSGSDDAQVFINDVNAVMLKLKTRAKYDEVVAKYEEIVNEYDSWRMAQTNTISFNVIDVVNELKDKIEDGEL